uniref:Uncharacterized protein n=2 Tax=unclassified bacterial viruses TaxID=12333 RepID=A0AAU6VYM5_9VIRU
MDKLKAVVQFALLLLASFVLIPVGWLVVALAIPFRVEGQSVSDGRHILNLPKWAWLWGNDYDGLLGDGRNWWAENTPYGWSVDSYKAMWWWAAIRNPVNNKRLTSWGQAPIIGSEITYSGQYTVEDKPGMGGWQFVTAEQNGKKWYGFYLVHEWNTERALVIRFGYKIKPLHAGTDEPAKGYTTKINPYKSI